MEFNRQEREIVLPADPERVWGVLTDLDGWRNWTGVLKPEIGQRLKIGGPLRLKAKASVWYLPFKYFPIRATVRELVPARRLIWDGSFLGIYGRHGMELEPLPGGRTRLIHWEEVHGYGRYFKDISGFWRAIRRSFDEFNLNLKNHLNKWSLDWTPRFVYLREGKVAYYEFGDGPAVLLVHGYPQSAYAWRHQIAELSRTHRLIALDLFGWGASDKNPSLIYDFDSEVARLSEFANAMRLHEFHLAAHDYGGLLALGYAIKHQENLKSVTIINSRAHATFKRHWLLAFSFILNFFFRAPFIRRLAKWLPVYSVHKLGLAEEFSLGAIDAEAVDRHLGHFKRDPNAKLWLIQFFTNGYSFAPKRAILSEAEKIKVPTTVIWGSKDKYLSTSVGRELASHLPYSRFVELNDRGHYVMEEAPDQVTESLTAAFARTHTSVRGANADF